LAESLGIMSHVSFLGNREDTGRYYGIMDVFTLVSSREGFGLVVPEAMLCGLPVVGTAVGGLKDSIVHGETGFLIPPMSPPSIAEAVLRLRDAPELRHQLGQAGRARAEALFSAARYARDVDTFYTELLSRPKSRLARVLTRDLSEELRSSLAR
jgi:glycosyltransferase involved in cell wall biosynthesis